VPVSVAASPAPSGGAPAVAGEDRFKPGGVIRPAQTQ
jgi:hypothetical protein